MKTEKQSETTKFLSKEELEHGEYYYGHHRNGTTCRWNGEEETFYYWRHKFGDKFLECIQHPADDDGFALFYPWHKIDYGTDEIPFKCT